MYCSEQIRIKRSKDLSAEQLLEILNNYDGSKDETTERLRSSMSHLDKKATDSVERRQLPLCNIVKKRVVINFDKDLAHRMFGYVIQFDKDFIPKLDINVEKYLIKKRKNPIQTQYNSKIAALTTKYSQLADYRTK